MTVLNATHQMDIMTHHPCFTDIAHDHVGRIHLPIAPRCNIQCNFCEHNMCATLAIQHPGWTAKLLSVTEAVDLIRSVMRFKQTNYFFVVGVAGPGDPLANDQTFKALGLIHKEYPHLLKCLSTNGLFLEDKLVDIINVGISGLTVTVNAVDSQVGKSIYSKVSYGGTVYRGEEAASILLTRQFSGIRKAVDAGLTIKVNTVLIPGVNDVQTSKIAMRVKEAGAKIMNIMPFMPSGKMKNRYGPSCDDLIKAQRECEKIIPQFRCCEHCRADVMYLP